MRSNNTNVQNSKKWPSETPCAINSRKRYRSSSSLGVGRGESYHEWIANTQRTRRRSNIFLLVYIFFPVYMEVLGWQAEIFSAFGLSPFYGGFKSKQTQNRLHSENTVVENHNRLKNTLFRSSEEPRTNTSFHCINSSCSFQKAEKNKGDQENSFLPPTNREEIIC